MGTGLCFGWELWCFCRSEPRRGGGRLHLQSLLALDGGVCLIQGFAEACGSWEECRRVCRMYKGLRPPFGAKRWL